MADRAQLIPTFVSIADTLVDDFDLIELLSMVTERCIDIFGVAAAGIMLIDDRGQLQVMSASSEAVQLLEVFESQSSQGPCPDCVRSGEPVLDQALRSSTDRWPDFAPKAIASGFESAEALPLRIRGKVIGALNLFGRTASGMAADDVAPAQALADVASIAILQYRAASSAQQLAEQLTVALTSRVVIEQAKGTVAERQGITVDAAFAVLRNRARRNGLRLVDVAQGVVDGTLTFDDEP